MYTLKSAAYLVYRYYFVKLQLLAGDVLYAQLLARTESAKVGSDSLADRIRSGSDFRGRSDPL